MPGAATKKSDMSWTAPPARTTHSANLQTLPRPQTTPHHPKSRNSTQRHKNDYSNYDNYNSNYKPNEKHKYSKHPKNKWWLNHNK